MLRAMENGETLFLFSERRYGKTSLVRTALRKLPRKNFISAYVDLWPTDTEAAFVAAIAKAITESMSSSMEKALEAAKIESELGASATSLRVIVLSCAGRRASSSSIALTLPARPGLACAA